MHRDALLDLGRLAAPVDATPELAVEVAPPDHPLALLPVRLETRFFGRDDGTTRAARAGVPRPDPHRRPRSPAQRRGVARGAAATGSCAGAPADDGDRLRGAWRLLTDRFEPGPGGVDRPRASNRPTRPTGRRLRWPPDAALPTPPQFPDVGEPAAVVRTPRAGGLPARWTATAYRGGAVVAVVTGRDIVADLAVGPDPDDALAPADDDPASLGDRRGHALDGRLRSRRGGGHGPAHPAARPARVAAESTCSSWWVSAPTPRPPAPTRLADLLDAHHHTDGLAFLVAGTPTNNSGAERAGYASRDHARRAELRRRVARLPAARPTSAPPPTPAGSAAALGFSPHRVLERRSDTSPAPAAVTSRSPRRCRPRCGRRRGATTSRSSRRSTTTARDWARDHARRFVRPAGALPTLRCGRQPYGVLPVTSLAGWSAAGDDAAPSAERLRQLLVTLRDQVWRPATIGAARVGRSDDPGADVVDVLRGGPTAPATTCAAPSARTTSPTCAGSSARTSTRSASSPACASSPRTC